MVHVAAYILTIPLAAWLMLLVMPPAFAGAAVAAVAITDRDSELPVWVRLPLALTLFAGVAWSVG